MKKKTVHNKTKTIPKDVSGDGDNTEITKVSSRLNTKTRVSLLEKSIGTR